MANPDKSLEKLKELVKSFFDDYLDYGESYGPGEGRLHPIKIRCSREHMMEPLDKLLKEMRELSR